MSELFDDDPRAATPARTSGGRSRALLVTLTVLVAAIFALTGFASIYTDRLWYRSAGYSQVFSTMLWTKVVLFLVFGLLLGGTVALNVYLAYRFRPLFRPSSREQSNLDRYRDVVTPIRTWLVVGVAVMLGAFAGASGLSHWKAYLLWRHGPDVAATDAYFDKSIGFYLFDLPWYHFVVDFVMATLVISLIAAVVTHYLYGGIRLQAAHDRLSGSAQAQLSVLLGLFVLAKGVDYYLDRFDLVTQKNRLFTGMNYTAENAVLPAKNILMVVALICAVLFFLNVWRRTWQLPSVGLALLALSAVLIGMIFPAVVQQFQVKPSEADREEPYIQANIAATQQAYDIDAVQSEPYSPTNTPPTELASFISNTSSVPSVDPRLLAPAFENLQQQFGYYSVPSVLDVDRYEVDGKQRAIVLAARELQQSALPDDARNWSNLHTVYTHGNGLIAAYANQRGRSDTPTGDTSQESSEGTNPPQWAQGLGTQDDLVEQLGDYESRLYYGEFSPDYSVVGKADPEDGDIELNLEVPGSDLGERTTYDGEGDASVGSAFNQLMFAIKFGEPNFLLSGRVNDNSKVLFERNPQDRVEKVAPWITVDSDAYPVIVPGEDGAQGRILWVLDGYTTTDRFPNAQRESFESMTEDALQVDTGFQTVPTDEINYMRNAVKATVDAYTGEVVLYAWDEEDPILQAWREAFPGSVQDADEMPDGLREHLRYPEDLFKVQRYQLARYHVDDARDWYANNDRWAVPTDPVDTNTFQAPYRLFVDGVEGVDGVQGATGPESETWALTSVYTPFGRNNLASFVQVNSDATSEGYGQMQVLELSNADSDSESEQTPGPGQVSNQFATNNEINDTLTDLRINSRVTLGNMLSFPVNGSMMYVQPVYAQNQQANTTSFPTLRYVLVSYGNSGRYVGFGTTLEAAIRNTFGGTVVTEPTAPDPEPQPEPEPEPGPGDPPGTGGTPQQRLDAALDRAFALFEQADRVRAQGDVVRYLELVQDGADALAEAQRLRDQIEGRPAARG